MNPKTLTTVLLICLINALCINAQCIDFCYCSPQNAATLCSLPLLQNDCEVKECTDATCSGMGWKCAPRTTKTDPIISSLALQQIKDLIKSQGGCKANVCFAIDGSGSISPAKQFSNELAFVRQVVEILKDEEFETRVAGTQYNSRSNPVSPLTEDLGSFISKVDNLKQVYGNTNIASGIDYCQGQVSQKLLQPNFVVVLGDGFENTVVDERKAVDAAKAARQTSSVTVVAVETVNPELLNELTGGDKKLAFQADDFDDIDGLAELIKKVALAICEKV